VPFTEIDREPVASLATHAAIAIETPGCSGEQGGGRSGGGQAVSETPRGLTDDAARLIHTRALALVEGDSGVVWLWDEAAQVVVPHHWTGFGAWLADVRVCPGEGVVGTVAARREGLLVNAFRTSPYATPLWLARSPHVAARSRCSGERLVGVSP
jgi:hypothetical protein